VESVEISLKNDTLSPRLLYNTTAEKRTVESRA